MNTDHVRTGINVGSAGASAAKAKRVSPLARKPLVLAGVGIALVLAFGTLALSLLNAEKPMTPMKPDKAQQPVAAVATTGGKPAVAATAGTFTPAASPDAVFPVPATEKRMGGARMAVPGK